MNEVLRCYMQAVISKHVRQPGDRDWTATFVCQSEGTTTRQPVNIVADTTQLRITYVNEGTSVTWGRCPA